MSVFALNQYDAAYGIKMVHNGRQHENNQPVRSWHSFAATVVERTATLLHAPTLMPDLQNQVFVASDPSWLNCDLAELEKVLSPLCIKVPLSLNRDAGELHVYQDVAGEQLPAPLVHKIVRLIVDHVLMAGQLPGYNVLKDHFIYSILNGLLTDPAVIELHASNLGLDLNRPRGILLIDASHYLTGGEQVGASEAQIGYRVSTLIGSIVNFFSLPNATICAYMGRGEIAVLKASDTGSLADWADSTFPTARASWANLTALKQAARALLAAQNEQLQAEFTIGVGRYYPGISGLAHSYQDARTALSLGRRFYGPNRVHCLDELGTASFIGISDERIKTDLALHILSPLHHEPMLLETLATFFKNNCIAAATKDELGIHRNTLNYRLDKIASLLGLDPRQFNEAVQIQLALLLRSPAAE